MVGWVDRDREVGVWCCGIERICVASITTIQMHTEAYGLDPKMGSIYKMYSQEKITYISCFTRFHVSGDEAGC